jgi:hypothetical protein
MAPLYRLAPWIVGLYESQLESLDHELAHLAEDYFQEGGAAGIMTPLPSLHRVARAAPHLRSRGTPDQLIEGSRR